MSPIVVAKLIVLLSVANGGPVLAKQIFGRWFSQSIDGGLPFWDGRPLFGPAKTIRGAVVSVVLTTLAAPLMGLSFATGALVGGMAMVGDLLSSFLKRRWDFKPSSRMSGLDQVPEALFPLLACSGTLSLTVADVIVGTTAFSVGSIFLSPLLYRLGIRDQPF
jgi:CDP-archaeol synthase